jgi:MgtC family
LPLVVVALVSNKSFNPDKKSHGQYYLRQSQPGDDRARGAGNIHNRSRRPLPREKRRSRLGGLSAHLPAALIADVEASDVREGQQKISGGLPVLRGLSPCPQSATPNGNPVMTTSIGQTAINLGVATLLGACIGFERQWRQRMAGLRTNTLVAIGAASFVIFEGLFPGEASPTRVAAPGRLRPFRPQVGASDQFWNDGDR